MTQRAPVIASFLLFLALCASVAYWLLLWLAPEPRPVAAPPRAERPLPPATAAANLFGGQPQAGMANVQLRGIIHAGRGGRSVAIIAAEGKPTRALGVNAEVLPGLTVKEVNARTVVLSDRGAARELTLPAFAAQEGGNGSLQADSPQPPPQFQQPQPAQPAPPPQLPQPAQLPQSVQPAQPTASGAGNPGTTAAGGGAPAQTRPALPAQPPR